MNQDIAEVLFDQNALQQKVAELGRQITRDFRDRTPLIVGVLKGSFVFMADLVRQIDLPCEVDFMAVSSYGKETRSSGRVRILKDLDCSLAGRDVLVVEDILDSGVTLSYLLDLFRTRGARSIRLCVLLNKPERHKVSLPIDYLGFDIPDAFVVGYGLDYAEKYRNLPYVGILKHAVYADSEKQTERRDGV